MIIETNTKILDIPGINLNQLIFLSVVLNKNQKNNQDVRKIVSLISDDEIQQLIDKDLITSIEKGNSITYTETDKLIKVITPDRDYFESRERNWRPRAKTNSCSKNNPASWSVRNYDGRARHWFFAIPNRRPACHANSLARTRLWSSGVACHWNPDPAPDPD